MMSLPHNFPCILYIYEILKIFIFFCCCSNMLKHVPISDHIRACILHIFRVDIGTVLHSHSCSWIYGIFVITSHKIHTNLRGNNINSLIHIDCSRNVSMKITEIQNFISSLFLHPIYIKLSLFCLKVFTLYIELTFVFFFFSSIYWINLNLDRISPLTHSWRNVCHIPWGTCPSELSWPWWVWRSCSQSTAAWSVGRAASGWSSPEFPLFVSVPSFRWCTSPFCNKVISFK